MKIFKRLSNEVKRAAPDTVLIHIGKCGGSTVRAELNKKGIVFTEKHLCNVQYKTHKQYIIVIRNPISRFISAFNWRYKLVVNDKLQGSRFQGEKNRLSKHQTANKLAENIYSDRGDLIIDLKSTENYIHHIAEDIDFYLGKFLIDCNPTNICAVITTEHLETDLRRHFDIQVETHLKQNTQVTYLSHLAIQNLTKYLRSDFECIEKLKNMQVISEAQYEALSTIPFPKPTPETV